MPEFTDKAVATGNLSMLAPQWAGCLTGLRRPSALPMRSSPARRASPSPPSWPSSRPASRPSKPAGMESARSKTSASETSAAGAGAPVRDTAQARLQHPCRAARRPFHSGQCPCLGTDAATLASLGILDKVRVARRRAWTSARAKAVFGAPAPTPWKNLREDMSWQSAVPPAPTRLSSRPAQSCRKPAKSPRHRPRQAVQGMQRGGCRHAEPPTKGPASASALPRHLPGTAKRLLPVSQRRPDQSSLMPSLPSASHATCQRDCRHRDRRCDAVLCHGQPERHCLRRTQRQIPGATCAGRAPACERRSASADVAE